MRLLSHTHTHTPCMYTAWKPTFPVLWMNWNRANHDPVSESLLSTTSIKGVFVFPFNKCIVMTAETCVYISAPWSMIAELEIYTLIYTTCVMQDDLLIRTRIKTNEQSRTEMNSDAGLLAAKKKGGKKKKKKTLMKLNFNVFTKILILNVYRYTGTKSASQHCCH